MKRPYRPSDDWPWTDEERENALASYWGEGVLFDDPEEV